MQITLEGHGEPVPVRAGDTMLESLLRAGVAFPFSCQAGNCGTCKCELVSGDILELEHSEHALGPEERAKGIILACRTQVWDDAVIRRIDAEDLVMHPSRVMRCRVLKLEALTHDIRGVRLAIETGGPLTFSAGQYAQLEFAPGLSRHYSMANTPDELELVFHVRRMPGGRTSGHVAEQLKIGDKVKVSGPLGVAYLRERHVGPVLLIAGGSGLAPIRSIASTLLGAGCEQPVALYFGVRSERDLYHEALLKDLAARHANFKYHVVLSEQKGASGRRYGLVHETVAADLDSTDNLMAYLAGPPVMVEAATALLAARGLAPRQIHADAFYNQL
jgi:CDP-4-dehydro-6-deoxyglucose reductase/ferredoxin-NAD(P)+ reductase (naphthalene dioxygenase ferredoxin-specific)